MYYGRKKGIIIAIVVVVLVLLLGIGGTCLYMFTDLFRSSETLFWKYAGKMAENLELKENIQLGEIAKLEEQSPYVINGELTAGIEGNDTEIINNALKQSKVTVTRSVDKLSNYEYNNLKIEYAGNSIFDMNYVNSNDIYALKSDEIVTAYIGVRNENLKVLAQKLQIPDIKFIPDKIKAADYSNLIEISEEEKQNLLNTYVPVIQQNISKEKYSKQTEAVIEKDGVSYNTTSYRVDLTSIDISNIVTQILNTLKTDAVTLNLIASKAQILELNEDYTTTDGIVSSIDDMINDISNVEFKDTSFVVYAYNGEAIATEIINPNEQKTIIYTTIQGDTQKINIEIENLGSSQNFDIANIEVTMKNTSTMSTIGASIKVDETEAYINIENVGSATQKSLDTNVEFGLTYNGTSAEVYYNQTMEFVDELEDMEELDNTNCAILNDYSTEQINTLIAAIANQIVTVYNEKAQMLGIISAPNEEITEEVNEPSNEVAQ